MIIDELLNHYGLKRYDVYQKTGLSQQTLASANRKGTKNLSGKVIAALAETIGKTSGQVLDELILIELSQNSIVDVNTKEEMLMCLKNKREFIVRGQLAHELLEISGHNFSEDEIMGFQIGSAGTGEIVRSFLMAIFDYFDAAPQDQKFIEKQMRMYNIEKLGDDKIMVKFRSRDF